MSAGQAFALGGRVVDGGAAAAAALDGLGLLGCGHGVQKEKGPRGGGPGLCGHSANSSSCPMGRGLTLACLSQAVRKTRMSGGGMHDAPQPPEMPGDRSLISKSQPCVLIRARSSVAHGFSAGL